MPSRWKELIGFFLGIAGFICSILSSALPMWRVTWVGSDATTSWGLWKVCRQVQPMGPTQCSSYIPPALTPTKALEDTRTLMTIAICLGIVALALALASSRYNSCIKDKVMQAKLALASGVAFIIPGLLVLISVCWLADTEIEIVRQNHPSNRILQIVETELGAALYIGCASTAMLLIGGGLVCSDWPPKGFSEVS